MNPKLKALGGIKEMLEGRMLDRMKPKKAVVVKETAIGLPEGSEGEEKLESPMVEKHEDAMGLGDVDDMSGPDEMSGGDISKLNPEEQAQLQMLYEKMGC